MVKIPKYIKRELQTASEYALKSRLHIKKFENWVKQTVGEDFDFDTLRAMSADEDLANQTEALTDIEYGNDVDIGELERVMNNYIQGGYRHIESKRK